MLPLVRELKHLTQAFKEDAYATQEARGRILDLCGTALWQRGYRIHADGLKGRHVQYLVAQWQAAGASIATLKNRLSVLRWWAAHVGNPGAVKPTNAAYGIGQRSTIARTSKATALPDAQLARVRNAYVQRSLLLQRAFGLRREESIKIQPWQADHGTVLVLKASWTKGGRPRSIPIETPAQRALLDEVKRFVRFQSASLIPPAKTYAQQLHSYEWQCTRVGLHKMHGLRHAYAQERFLTLAGFPAPVAGGPSRATMSAVQREIDYDVRVIISAELGHGREAVTATYLGR
jgi:site-specific recombinase XerC